MNNKLIMNRMCRFTMSEMSQISDTASMMVNLIGKNNCRKDYLQCYSRLFREFHLSPSDIICDLIITAEEEFQRCYGEHIRFALRDPYDGTNLCPVCQTDMGRDYPSQVCSRRCLMSLS